ncbi:MAG: 30S ribosomal protein S16 [Terriglobia bacterium]
MLKIRLARAGAKKKASFRVVVIEEKRARNGRFVEILGFYNPRREPPEVALKHERVDYWLGVGAQPSDTVRSLLKRTAKPQAVAS